MMPNNEPATQYKLFLFDYCPAILCLDVGETTARTHSRYPTDLHFNCFPCETMGELVS